MVVLWSSTPHRKGNLTPQWFNNKQLNITILPNDDNDGMLVVPIFNIFNGTPCHDRLDLFFVFYFEEMVAGKGMVYLIGLGETAHAMLRPQGELAVTHKQRPVKLVLGPAHSPVAYIYRNGKAYMKLSETQVSSECLTCTWDWESVLTVFIANPGPTTAFA